MGSLSSATRRLTASTSSPGTPLPCVLCGKCGIRGWQELAVGQFPLWIDGHLTSVPSPPLSHLSSSVSSYVCFPPCFIVDSFQTYTKSRGSGGSKPHIASTQLQQLSVSCPLGPLHVTPSSISRLPLCAPASEHLPLSFHLPQLMFPSVAPGRWGLCPVFVPNMSFLRVLVQIVW